MILVCCFLVGHFSQISRMGGLNTQEKLTLINVRYVNSSVSTSAEVLQNECFMHYSMNKQSWFVRSLYTFCLYAAKHGN